MALIDELERLAALHQQGQLSDTEYAQAKARLLAAPAPMQGAAEAINTLRRSRHDRWLGGVCGGLGALTGMASWVWRLMFLLLLAFAGSGIVVYALMWLLVPDEPLLPPSAAQAG